MTNHTEDFLNQLKFIHNNIRECIKILSYIDQQQILDDFDSGYEQAWLETISMAIQTAIIRNSSRD